MMAASFDDYVFCHAVYLLILAKKRRTKDFFFNARDSGGGLATSLAKLSWV